MTESEYIRNMKFLIEKYVTNPTVKENLLKNLKNYGSEGAKGILHDFCQATGDIELEDSRIIKDINFYFI